jgi:hypothetical protein
MGVDLANTVIQPLQKASNAASGRLSALYAAKAGLAAYDLYERGAFFDGGLTKKATIP